MEELLKGLGYTDEQIKAILDGMKEKKIFTSNEENLDIRYGKLKTDYDGKIGELENANKLIEDLKKKSKGNEDLQGKITEYETEKSRLQAENEKLKKENALKFGLLSSGAKKDDIDYLMFKINQNNPELKLDEQGNIKDLDDILDSTKKAYPANYESETKRKVEVKVPGGEEEKPGAGEKEPQSLEEALKQKYLKSEE